MLNYHKLYETLVTLEQHLKAPTTLMLIGAAPAMLLNQGQTLAGEARVTMDIDIWTEGSKFQLSDLKNAASKAGLLFNPTSFEEPTTPYLQLVEPGIVFVPPISDTPTPLLTLGKLTLVSPNVKDYIASKLVRGSIKDALDCALLALHFKLPPVELRTIHLRLKACKGITKGILEQSQENATLVEQLYNVYNV